MSMIIQANMPFINAQNKYKVSTIKEILEIPLDKKYHPNFYLDNSTKYGKEVIDKIHSMGLKFNCEEEKKDRLLKKEDKIELLDLNTKLYRTLRSAGIVTIEDLLKNSGDVDGREIVVPKVVG